MLRFGDVVIVFHMSTSCCFWGGQHTYLAILTYCLMCIAEKHIALLSIVRIQNHCVTCFVFKYCQLCVQLWGLMGQMLFGKTEKGTDNWVSFMYHRFIVEGGWGICATCYCLSCVSISWKTPCHDDF